MNRQAKYPPELRERAIRMVYEQREHHESQWAAIESVAEEDCVQGPDAEKLEFTPETPGEARIERRRCRISQSPAETITAMPVSAIASGSWSKK